MATSEQLERLLYVLPAAARTGGARLADLARALRVEPAVVLADIEQATARAFYHPAGSVDAFTILVDGENVQVEATTEFQRPVRLNMREAMALDLGLRVLASEHAERRTEILGLADRLKQEIVAPAVEVQPSIAVSEAAALYDVELEVALGPDDFRGVLMDAIERGNICEIEYLKPLGREPETRRIAPRRLVYDHGHWYVAAWDVDVAQPRNFRLDRMLQVSETAEAHEAAAVAESATAYTPGEHDFDVTVRYSPRIARWIAEGRDVAREADGSVVVTHRVSDPQWLVRHVLQYGGEAVIETDSMRRVLAAAALRVVA